MKLHKGQEYIVHPPQWRDEHRFRLVGLKDNGEWMIEWQYTKEFNVKGYVRNDYHDYSEQIFLGWIRDGWMTQVIKPVTLPEELFTL